MITLPNIKESFEKIAMDIIGPLPHSQARHRYVLVVYDYTTRYPEAMLLWTSSIPKEILTEEGSNMTSQQLAKIYRLLHVHLIQTTPYHLETDGLEACFNKTLKALPRKAIVDEGKDWD